MFLKLLGFISTACLICGLLSSPGYGASFYAGKTVTLIQGRTPAGTGDVRARAVIEYLQKYLGDGKVTFVSRYMPGGGGTLAANYIARNSRRDGLTVGNIGSSLFPNAILGARGVRYKLEDFVFLGSASPGNPYTLVIRPGLDLNSVKKVKGYQGLRFAQRSVGHAMYILDRIVAYTLELKDPKWILGYSSSEIPLALEKGEADAESTSIPSILRETPQWINKFAFPVTIKNAAGQGAEAVPGFPQGLPTLEQFADTQMKRELLQFNKAIRPTAAPYFVPKGVPEKPLRELKEAFDKVWKDPEFAAAYKKATAGEDAVPMTGEEIETILASRPSNPEVRALYLKLIGAGPLPAAK